MFCGQVAIARALDSLPEPADRANGEMQQRLAGGVIGELEVPRACGAGTLVQQTMRGLVFEGVSGEVAFDAEGDRADARYSVSHMRPDKEW